MIVTPHHSAAAQGNHERIREIFIGNLGRWQRGEALLNDVSKSQTGQGFFASD